MKTEHTNAGTKTNEPAHFIYLSIGKLVFGLGSSDRSEINAHETFWTSPFAIFVTIKIKAVLQMGT